MKTTAAARLDNLELRLIGRKKKEETESFDSVAEEKEVEPNAGCPEGDAPADDQGKTK